MISRICRDKYNIKKVILGGGVFLNSFLLSRTLHSLTSLGMEVYIPRGSSFGDEGISAGQAFYSALNLSRGE
jgi:hydrogenase maturation protein HypF